MTDIQHIAENRQMPKYYMRKFKPQYVPSNSKRLYARASNA